MGTNTSTKKPNILIVEDDSLFAKSVEAILTNRFELTHAEDAQEAMKVLVAGAQDLILLDYDLPHISGYDFLKILKSRFPEVPVIMLTGHEEAQIIIETMQAGASDYVMKGQIDLEITLNHRINQILEKIEILNRNKRLLTDVNAAKGENLKLKEKLCEQQLKYQIQGVSAHTLNLKSDILKLKNTSAFVIITGENGTGKELVARNLNLQEEDKSRPFIAVNCAGIPPNLFESEFFGHVKGSFTGATENKVGKFEAANGGDIFLDEIGEIPLEMQSKLLRVLQEKTVSKIGSNESIPVDFRVIAATNRNLEQEVKEGRFREDLYFRLHQICIHVEPLRKRQEDILFLANMFLKKIMPMGYFSDEANSELTRHEWRGNIRELQNTIERACVFAKDRRYPVIKPEHLMISKLKIGKSTLVASLPSSILPSDRDEISEIHFAKAMAWMENHYFEAGLKLMDGDNAEFCKKLNMSRSKYFRHKKSSSNFEN